MGMYPDIPTLIAQKYREKLAEGKNDKQATKEILEDVLHTINEGAVD